MTADLLPVRRAFVDTPDGQIHIRSAGTGDGRAPLLMLHQSPASSLTYAEILPHLGRYRRAIAIDTPGFGESFRPAVQPGIADYARHIVAAADALGIGRFDLMGIFTGAGIASEIAASRPARVRRCLPPTSSAGSSSTLGRCGPSPTDRISRSNGNA